MIAFLELQTRKIDSADEVVGDLGLAVVGSLPMLPARARRNGVMARQEKDRYWYSLLLESIDATRTMLIHAARSGSHRVVMIASALPGEGKTSLASHLATSLARSGQKTLLIDADLRCPSIHRLFDLTPNPGLSELLRGEVALDDVIVSTAVEELKVITAGQCDPQTLRILSQGGLGGLFARLKEQYDFVIVDSSPILRGCRRSDHCPASGCGSFLNSSRCEPEDQDSSSLSADRGPGGQGAWCRGDGGPRS